MGPSIFSGSHAGSPASSERQADLPSGYETQLEVPSFQHFARLPRDPEFSVQRWLLRSRLFRPRRLNACCRTVSGTSTLKDGQSSSLLVTFRRIFRFGGRPVSLRTCVESLALTDSPSRR